ncbi:hypothetical protein [Paenibacillus terrae]|nr:hypothetical protein [Paenibacillus terrae]
MAGLKYPDGMQIHYEYNKQSRTGYVLAMLLVRLCTFNRSWTAWAK